MPSLNSRCAAHALAAALMTATASPAFAYMGAGAGLSAIGSILSFLGVILLMIVGFVWYPFKRAIKKMRDNKNPESEVMPPQ